MCDLEVDAFAVRAKHRDFVTKKSRSYQLQVVPGATAALNQQFMIRTPRDHWNAAVPTQQYFVRLK
jgi:hypothetical protein